LVFYYNCNGKLNVFLNFYDMKRDSTGTNLTALVLHTAVYLQNMVQRNVSSLFRVISLFHDAQDSDR